MLGLINNVHQLNIENFKLKIALTANRKMDYLFEKIFLTKGKVNKSDIKRKISREIKLVEDNIDLFSEADILTTLSLDKYDPSLDILNNIYNYFKEMGEKYK